LFVFFCGVWFPRVLHSFPTRRSSDLDGPIDGVVLDADGNLYGTTFFGGVNSSSGTIFKVSNAGVETILHDFGAPGSIGSEIEGTDRKSTRLNSSHRTISYAVFCLKKK